MQTNLSEEMRIAALLRSVPEKKRMGVIGRASLLVGPDFTIATLKELFEWQMALIEINGLAQADEIKPLYPLLARIPDIVRKDGILPFIIMVNRQGLAFSERMVRVMVNGLRGISYLDDNRLANTDELPAGHYLATIVEDGRHCLGRHPDNCLKEFSVLNRFGGTTAEGITLAMITPEVLVHHSIDTPGSVYDGNDGRSTPCISFSSVATFRDANYSHPKLFSWAAWKKKVPYFDFCGSISVGGRLGLPIC
ncbi:MAG: hypothetical protein A3I97_00505 [Candidatus Taylorbacteria bacterium RIFCSPLOWO2_02_FULL_44_35]|nr:MAG: hypothetical protein A3I97_00505 [Candidatus Taylorbacteria bacterium RIFCSPLOWO2_02_FULL_44_35]